MMATTLGLYVLAAITQHLAFRTFSHDFSMIDAALYETHAGRFLYAPVLQHSFLAEHFSPVLLLLVRFHALFTTPWLLVIVQPVALWAAAWVLKRILDEQGVTPALRNGVLLVYLNHPVTISTLSYLFHMECFLPLCLFGAFLLYRRRRRLGFAVTLLVALTIKEDVGIYLVGFAAWLAIGARQWGGGVVLALVSLAWTLLAVFDWMPRFLPSPQLYPFLQRWSAWGDDPVSIGLGFLRHPVRLVTALLHDPIPRYLACLGFLPLLRPAAILLFVAPWILNATSGSVLQASMSLYYGMPFLTFAILAGTVTLSSEVFHRVREWRFSFAAGCFVLMLNVAHFTFPEIPLDRFTVLRHIGATPKQATVQAMSCFFPVLDYGQPKQLRQADSELGAEYVLLRRRGGTWPLSGLQVEALRAEARRRGYDEVYASAGFAILHRRPASPAAGGAGGAGPRGAPGGLGAATRAGDPDAKKMESCRRSPCSRACRAVRRNGPLAAGIPGRRVHSPPCRWCPGASSGLRLGP